MKVRQVFLFYRSEKNRAMALRWCGNDANEFIGENELENVDIEILYVPPDPAKSVESEVIIIVTCDMEIGYDVKGYVCE
jgi:hypothetical protein